MKTAFCSFGLLMAAVPVFAQNTGKDSIVSTKALDDVVVSASNISRVGDHLVIYPNSQQRKHAVNGFGVLENLNIPGLIIDAKSNQVDVMGLQAALYLNGQECDIREIQMLRPRDIEKIEYHDAPSGKYAKDKLVVNFITKQYRYGGYVQADGLQAMGYDHGDYNVATNYVKGNNSYTVFAGANYSHVDGTETWNNENYQFSQSLLIGRAIVRILTGIIRNICSSAIRTRRERDIGWASLRSSTSLLREMHLLVLRRKAQRRTSSQISGRRVYLLRLT